MIEKFSNILKNAHLSTITILLIAMASLTSCGKKRHASAIRGWRIYLWHAVNNSQNKIDLDISS